VKAALVTSDEALMLEFQGGSRAAFEELFARYREPLYGFFRRRVESAERAEDLMQETFLAVIRASSRYEPRALVRTYLYGIALKLVMAERRCQARNGTPADTAPEPAAQAAAEVGMCVGTGSDWKIGRIGAGNSHAAGVRTVELFRDFRSAAHSCKHRPFPAVSSAPGLEGSS